VTRLRIVFGLALAGACVVLAVFAVPAWRYPAAAARQDDLIERRPEHAWSGSRGFLEQLAGARDDASMRRAIALFRASRPDVPGGTKSAAQVLSSLESAVMLSREVRGRSAAERRSLAANLAGILFAEDALFEPDGGPRVARAAELFRRAITLDPGNGAAKTNLELLYAYSTAESSAPDEGGGFGGFGDDAGAGGAGGGY
jgi:hypothetical protein